MNQQAETTAGARKGAKGRKDRDGIEEVIKVAPIKEASGEVMRLLKRSLNAAGDYKAALKAMAERSNTNSRNLNRLFKASEKGNFADVRRDVDQQQVLFEMVGEIQGGAETEK